jgi:hypothetical protein
MDSDSPFIIDGMVRKRRGRRKRGQEGEAYVQLVTYSDAEKSHGKQNRHDLLQLSGSALCTSVPRNFNA